MNKKAKNYWKSLTSEQKQALADRCDMSKRHLSVLFNGQVVGYEKAIKIARQTNGKLKPNDIRKRPY